VEGKLDFAAAFARGDAAIKQFNDIPVAERKSHFLEWTSSVPQRQVKAMFDNMKHPNRNTRIKKIKPDVCDYKDWKELDSLIAAQGSLNSINGLPNSEDKVSIDRTFIGDNVKYNWEVQVMGIRDNDAKVSGRFIFRNQDAMNYWIAKHPELAGMNNHQVVAYELRIRYMALLNTYYSPANLEVAPVQREDYEVEVDEEDFMDGVDDE
jgi:hypothetical protein